MWLVGVVARGRRLPPTGLPVGRLDRLEVVGDLRVVELNHALKGADGVAAEQMRHMVGKVLIHAGRAESGLDCGIDRTGDVVIHLKGALAGRVTFAVVDIRRDGVVPGLRNRHDTVTGEAGVGRGGGLFGAEGASFRGGAIVHALRDHSPPHVDVCQTSLENRRRSGHREHNGRQYGQLVVHVTTLIHIAGLEGYLL